MANTYACKNAIKISKPVSATINTSGNTPVKKRHRYNETGKDFE